MAASSPPRSIARALSAFALLGVVAALYLPASGCGPACSAADRYYDGGTTLKSGAETIWETNPIDGAFLPFEGAVLYHLHHGLGVKPYATEITLSFSDHPEVAGNGGYAQSAGNQVLVLSATDQEVVIKNDSCASYYFRAVIRAIPGDGAGGDAGAVSDGGR